MYICRGVSQTVGRKHVIYYAHDEIIKCLYIFLPPPLLPPNSEPMYRFFRRNVISLSLQLCSHAIIQIKLAKNWIQWLKSEGFHFLLNFRVCFSWVGEIGGKCNKYRQESSLMGPWTSVVSVSESFSCFRRSFSCLFCSDGFEFVVDEKLDQWLTSAELCSTWTQTSERNSTLILSHWLLHSRPHWFSLCRWNMQTLRSSHRDCLRRKQNSITRIHSR